MNFEFATATQIIFGPGTLKKITDYVTGKRVFVVTSGRAARAQPLLDLLPGEYTVYSVPGEPTVEMIREATAQAAGFDAVIGMGGGSAIDAGKAIAALATNPGDPLDYLEVVGKGQSLKNPPLPYYAIPTTAGTGAEVTKNAVLAVTQQRVKVSLRSPLMLPRLALLDPELTLSLPPEITASTGLDALTQVLEPFVSKNANPITDALAKEGLMLAARALRRAYTQGDDLNARSDMMLASLLGGMALANAKLGAVHGFAGVLGGMFNAPHGAVCAVLLPHVMTVNVRALQAREPENPALRRYDVLAPILTGHATAQAADAVRWVQDLCAELQVPPLGHYGITPADFSEIIEKSAASSSMKGNPITLTHDELAEILTLAL